MFPSALLQAYTASSESKYHCPFVLGICTDFLKCHLHILKFTLHTSLCMQEGSKLYIGNRVFIKCLLFTIRKIHVNSLCLPRSLNLSLDSLKHLNVLIREGPDMWTEKHRPFIRGGLFLKGPFKKTKTKPDGSGWCLQGCQLLQLVSQ